MVRFEEKLRNNMVKEWVQSYLEYSILKGILNGDGGPTDIFGRLAPFRNTLHLGASSSLHERLTDDDILVDATGESNLSRVRAALFIDSEEVPVPSEAERKSLRFKERLASELIKVDIFFLHTLNTFEDQLRVLEEQSASVKAQMLEAKVQKSVDLGDAARPPNSKDELHEVDKDLAHLAARRAPSSQAKKSSKRAYEVTLHI